MVNLLALVLLMAVMLLANGARWQTRLALGDWGSVLSETAIVAIVYMVVAGLVSAGRRVLPLAARLRPGWTLLPALLVGALVTLYQASTAARIRESAFQRCLTSAGAEAILACTRALQLGRRDRRDEAVILNNRGLVLQKAGEAARAIADLDNALATDPSLASAWFNRGLARAQLSQWTAAIADFSEAGRLRPDLPAVWASRGSARLVQRDLDAAVADLNDKEVSAWSGRGMAYYLKGDIERAKTDLRRATALDGVAATATDALREIEAREAGGR